MVVESGNCPYFPLQMVILTGKWAVAVLNLASGTYVKHKLNYWALGKQEVLIDDW
ncbi:hypothetical protein [Nostoc sp. PA-18-2419]|uniref:hypothetical protein n=1 Tax=Nostoc sp. PA-18-2419 TaxID=2575443 RepID=UPI001CB8B44A|nr:hypothetical protein [Nostoc sp. PA-18-2419]